MLAGFCWLTCGALQAYVKVLKSLHRYLQASVGVDMLSLTLPGLS